MDVDSPQQDDGARGTDGASDAGRTAGDGNDEVNQDDQSQHQSKIGTGGGGNGSIMEPDSVSSTMSASSIGEASSTSSGINSSFRDDDFSLSDSVQLFPKEFGRTYHAYRAGSYAFPNDLPEQERLEFQGQTIKMLLEDKLYFAPLSQPRAILDVATGIGDWAIQMGDMFPDALVYGTDLSPIQPAEVPPNVHFFVEDATDPWVFNHKFDYIHTRFTTGCWGSFETEIAEQAFDALEPGGWFESQEIDCNIRSDDNTLEPTSALGIWYDDLVAASEKLGRPALLGVFLKEIYEKVGFVDVQQRIYKMPLGRWPRNSKLKQIGYMWGTNMLEGLAGFSFQLLNKAFERTRNEIEVSLVNVRKDIMNPRIHTYLPTFVVYGRKPYPGEVVKSGQ